jgi:hypothetical protein
MKEDDFVEGVNELLGRCGQSSHGTDRETALLLCSGTALFVAACERALGGRLPGVVRRPADDVQRAANLDLVLQSLEDAGLRPGDFTGDALLAADLAANAATVTSLLALGDLQAAEAQAVAEAAAQQHAARSASPEAGLLMQDALARVTGLLRALGQRGDESPAEAVSAAEAAASRPTWRPVTACLLYTSPSPRD